MKLTVLDCTGTRVADLLPRGMPLTAFSCTDTRVFDPSLPRGMPLTHLSFNYTPVSDLSPLKGMPLGNLVCGGTKVTDLTPLRGMPLRYLSCDFQHARMPRFCARSRCWTLSTAKRRRNSGRAWARRRWKRVRDDHPQPVRRLPFSSHVPGELESM